MRLCVLCPILAAVIALILLLFAPAPTHAQPPIDPKKPVSFMDHVAPVLKENCFACHDTKKRKGKLDLTTWAGIMKGGDRGPAVTPNEPGESPMWILASGKDDPTMPPKEVGGLLPKHRIAVIERWIKEGAKFDGPSATADLFVELRKRYQPPTPPVTYRYPSIVRAIAFAPEGDTLVVGGYHELLVWDYKGGKLLKRIRTRAERANAIAFLPDGKTVAVAGGRPGQEGDVRFYDLSAKGKKEGAVEVLDGVDPKGGVLVRELAQLDDEILTLAISPDGKKLAAGGCDRLVRIWDLEKFTLEQTVENHADWVLGVVFSSDSKRVYTASRDKTAKAWDIAGKESVLTYPGHQTSVNGVAVRPDGKVGVSGGDDRQLRFWNTTSDAKQIRTAGGHGDKVERVLYHPTRPLVISCSDDKTVRIWNPDTGASIRTLSGHSDCVFAIAVSADGNLIASGSWDGEVRVWKLDDGALVKAFNASPLK
jgi:hypothetical protein